MDSTGSRAKFVKITKSLTLEVRRKLVVSTAPKAALIDLLPFFKIRKVS
jgi:hypothetical protein